MNLKPYRKTIIAGITAFCTAVYAVITDDVVTAQECVLVLIQVLTAVGVYEVRNTPVA